MKRKVKVLAIQFLLLLVFLELGLALSSSLGWANLGRPTYNFKGVEHFWNQPDSTIAVWRSPGHSYRHMTSCFNVEYVANQQGMRDVERQVKSDRKRVLVLGDSFTEGWGVSLQERFTNVLEKNTGIEFLNFGIFNSGMTQQSTLYSQKAIDFDHEAILWTIFPENDILDDDPAFSSVFHADEYKPYLEGSYPEYELTYGPTDFEGVLQKKVGLGGWQGILRNFTHTWHLLRYLKLTYLARSSFVSESFGEVNGYFELTESHWGRIRFNIERLLKTSGDKPVYIAMIPGKYNVQQYKHDPKLPLPLTDSLNALSRELGFEFYDMLSEYSTPDLEFRANRYFSCDNHWNKEGHQWAAAVMDSVFTLSNIFEPTGQ